MLQLQLTILHEQTTKESYMKRLETQRDVIEATKAVARWKERYYNRQAGPRALANLVALERAIAEARSRAIPCDGPAHSNPWIDNCGYCMPWWGVCMPYTRKEQP